MQRKSIADLKPSILSYIKKDVEHQFNKLVEWTNDERFFIVESHILENYKDEHKTRAAYFYLTQIAKLK